MALEHTPNIWLLTNMTVFEQRFFDYNSGTETKLFLRYNPRFSEKIIDPTTFKCGIRKILHQLICARNYDSSDVSRTEDN